MIVTHYFGPRSRTSLVGSLWRLQSRLRNCWSYTHTDTLGGFWNYAAASLGRAIGTCLSSHLTSVLTLITFTAVPSGQGEVTWNTCLYSSNPQFQHFLCFHLLHNKVMKTVFHLTSMVAPNREAVNHLEKRNKERTVFYSPYFLYWWVSVTWFSGCSSVSCPFSCVLSVRKLVGRSLRPLRRAEGTNGAENSLLPLAP